MLKPKAMTPPPRANNLTEALAKTGVELNVHTETY